MALSAEDQAWVQAQIAAANANKTVRIPELPASSDYGDLSLEDRLPLWIKDLNKTVYTDLALIRTLIMTGGGGGSIHPAINGNSIVVTVGAAEADKETFHIPALAGKGFVLRRTIVGALKPPFLLDGTPNPEAEYEILNSGGFKILNGQLLSFGETFELELNEPAGPLLTEVGAIIKGVKRVESTEVLNASHAGLLVQIRAGNTPIDVTLPNIDTVAPYSMWFFESAILNTATSKIKTSAGQFIYFNSSSKNNLIIGPGESITFYAGSDGWYAIMPYGAWKDVGKIQARFGSVPYGEQALDGSLLSRDANARLFEHMQTLGSSIVTEAAWNTDYGAGLGGFIAKSLWTLGTDGTNFRVPDFSNLFLRGLKPGDTERANNVGGGYQHHMYQQHDHSLPTDGGGTTDRPTLISTANTDEGLNNSQRTGASGGSETRPINAAVIWTIVK